MPIILGLIAIIIFFQLEQSKFLSATNLVNLFVQSALYVMFGAAEFFALIMSEIDLSIGYLAGVVRVHDRRADGRAGQPPVVAGGDRRPRRRCRSAERYRAR